MNDAYKWQQIALGRIKELVKDWKQSDRHILGAVGAVRQYRGKEQFVVGYEWCRPGSSPITGRVYETILGYGDSFHVAYDRALAAIAKRADTIMAATAANSKGDSHG